MNNKKGITSFTSFIIAIIIIIPVLFVVYLIYTLGIGSIQSQLPSASSYVSLTMSALSTGESVVTGTLSPTLTENQFMAQFYGSPACITLLDELSRVGVLSSPNDPTTLSDRFFVCIGTFTNVGSNSSAVTNFYGPSTSGDSDGIGGWSFLPSSLGQPSFPFWTSSSPSQNYQVFPSEISGAGGFAGINGSEGTLTYAIDAQDVNATLASSCIAFLNATNSGTSVGALSWGDPSAYISSINCAALNENNGQAVYLSVENSQCSGTAEGCEVNPWLFLHGNPGSISLQTCSYSQGDQALTCQLSIN